MRWNVYNLEVEVEGIEVCRWWIYRLELVGGSLGEGLTMAMATVLYAGFSVLPLRGRNPLEAFWAVHCASTRLVALVPASPLTLTLPSDTEHYNSHSQPQSEAQSHSQAQSDLQRRVVKSTYQNAQTQSKASPQSIQRAFASGYCSGVAAAAQNTSTRLLLGGLSTPFQHTDHTKPTPLRALLLKSTLLFMVHSHYFNSTCILKYSASELFHWFTYKILVH